MKARRTCNVADASPKNGRSTSCLPHCGVGTEWDPTLEECVTIADTTGSEPEDCPPSCGPGTIWDPVNEECIIAIPTDNDLDGCVTAGDVLNLLATFGTCPPVPEWPDEPTDTTWSCGDIVTYFGFDYPTVQIGNQCWFTENLRNTQYANGDDIPGGLDGVAWDTTQEGAWSIYGEGSSDCYGPCDEVENLDWHGRLYNFEAVTDPRGLCPSGWHAPPPMSSPRWSMAWAGSPQPLPNSPWKARSVDLEQEQPGWTSCLKVGGTRAATSAYRTLFSSGPAQRGFPMKPLTTA